MDLTPLFSRYDFFLVSQSVRQGTVTPTHYNVIFDQTGLKPDHIQRLTYKLCHLYYNWPVRLTLVYCFIPTSKGCHSPRKISRKWIFPSLQREIWESCDLKKFEKDLKSHEQVGEFKYLRQQQSYLFLYARQRPVVLCCALRPSVCLLTLIPFKIVS